VCGSTAPPPVISNSLTSSSEPLDYAGKDEEAIAEPDKTLIGPPSELSEHNPDLSFPSL
jgi:hypothetical protein